MAQKNNDQSVSVEELEARLKKLHGEPVSIEELEARLKKLHGEPVSHEALEKRYEALAGEKIKLSIPADPVEALIEQVQDTINLEKKDARREANRHEQRPRVSVDEGALQERSVADLRKMQQALEEQRQRLGSSRDLYSTSSWDAKWNKLNGANEERLAAVTRVLTVREERLSHEVSVREQVSKRIDVLPLKLEHHNEKQLEARAKVLTTHVQEMRKVIEQYGQSAVPKSLSEDYARFSKQLDQVKVLQQRGPSHVPMMKQPAEAAEHHPPTASSHRAVRHQESDHVSVGTKARLSGVSEKSLYVHRFKQEIAIAKNIGQMLGELTKLSHPDAKTKETIDHLKEARNKHIEIARDCRESLRECLREDARTRESTKPDLPKKSK